MTNVNDAAAWLAICKEEGQKIDPETAEVTWWWANELDPYGIHPDIEEDSINRVCFARRPDGDVWVCFSDLPTATVQRLEDRAARTLTPAQKILLNDLFNQLFDAIGKEPELESLLGPFWRMVTACRAAADESERAALVKEFAERLPPVPRFALTDAIGMFVPRVPTPWA
jgi:hypothetical protein